jgi:hypothetical protein
MKLTHHVYARQGDAKHEDGLVSIRWNKHLLSHSEVHALIDQLTHVARTMYPATMAEHIPSVRPMPSASK